MGFDHVMQQMFCAGCTDPTDDDGRAENTASDARLSTAFLGRFSARWAVASSHESRWGPRPRILDATIPSHRGTCRRDRTTRRTSTPRHALRWRGRGRSAIPRRPTGVWINPPKMSHDDDQVQHEEGLPEIGCPGKPAAPLAHPRHGYPSPVCVPQPTFGRCPARLRFTRQRPTE